MANLRIKYSTPIANGSSVETVQTDRVVKNSICPIFETRALLPDGLRVLSTSYSEAVSLVNHYEAVRLASAGEYDS